MLSAVLQSPRAIGVSIEIVRGFVRLRRMLADHADLRRKLDALQSKYDEQFAVVFDALRQLMTDDERQRRKPTIGFGSEGRARK